METLSEVQMSGGREFQRLGTDRLKALDPMVVRLADGVKSWMAEEDRRVWEGVWIWISSDSSKLQTAALNWVTDHHAYKIQQVNIYLLLSFCKGPFS